MSFNLAPLNVSLALSSANTIIEAALTCRQQHEFLPLCVVVLDAGGQLVACQREDGCSNLRFEIARGKAAAALGMGMSSRLIAERLGQRPVFLGAIASAADGQFVPVPGGVLILDSNGNAIGAVGISGDNSDQDELCAITGIQAAGLASEPAESGLG